MKRKALLIGNTSGLQGVKIDIVRFSRFLNSDSGGRWYDSEIDILENESKSALLRKVKALKDESLDYLIVLFSGHGGQLLRQTVLEINANGETLEETCLRGVATRQLNIYDCCRSESTPLLKSNKMDSRTLSMLESVSIIREKYEKRIMEAIPQQALLYSCSVGQVSYDTANGGVYLSNLLDAARVFPSDQSFKLVGLAHEQSVAPTLANSMKEKYGPQVPEAVLPKCLSSQQLIISMKA